MVTRSLRDLADVPLDLVDHRPGPPRPVKLVVGEALGRLADGDEAAAVPVAVAGRNGLGGLLVDPPVPGEGVAGEHVDGGGLAVGFRRARRGDVPQIDRGDAGGAGVEGRGVEEDRPGVGGAGEDPDEGLRHGLPSPAPGGPRDEGLNRRARGPR